MGVDLDAYLAKEEQQFPDITPGVQKRIVWAGARGAQTPVAIVYIHGFSATSQEIRPVPDDVARALGANLFYTRLAGHGLGGPALATATTGKWMNDLAEALAIGHRIGKRVIVMATSTGGTLAAIGASDPRLKGQIDGLVLLSPNFAMRDPKAVVLTMPLARYWAPLIAGRKRCFTPHNPLHKKYWTTCYPSVAVFPVGALVAYAGRQDYSRDMAPALFLYAPADEVVDERRTAEIAAGWGGPHEVVKRVMGPGDDPSSHVIAGDILSPGQTAGTEKLILDWAKRQGF
ncbi:alpha/beta hydrolase [Acidimangrovimonas pyrenivorans]|uniref:Alpha/beta hydrolase n=1 Tax=Acidimangrovimonas pyrenivorans TaxID=2030798 RepID=A0ABV7ABT2_9RHOB